MSSQVAGEPEGVTLLDAINAGRVPTPGELKFPDWQAWRRGPGKRPTVRRDGRGLRTQEEVALWREVMTALYGEGRADELGSEGEEEEPADLPVVPASVPVPLTPSHSPGSAASEQGRGDNSPRPSSVASGGASVSSLQAKLKALYDPSGEDLGAYLMRMGRTIEALTTLGASAPAGALEKCTRKAELVVELYAEHGSLERARAVRFLRDRFLAHAQDENISSEEKDLSIAAIGELIEQLGGRPSASPEKLFSTPSDSKQGGEAARGPAGRGSVPASSGGPKIEEDRLRAQLAAAEIELEGLRRDKAESEAGSSAGQNQGLVSALEEQTRVLKEVLTSKGNSSSITAVKTDLHWPVLGDDRSDFKDVNAFYEEFEDICALANACKGMNHREMLIALRSRCRGSRLKTYTNLYRAAWKSGEVLDHPEAVYERIKKKHLMFSESREEREIRIDSEHVSLMKGKLTGHQFEPLFEHSVAELESVGLGKTPRELFLSYLRKVGPSLQKEIRSDKRLWGSESTLRSPQTWEEAHRVVLEYEQREATNRATANAVYSIQDTDKPTPKPKPAPKNGTKKKFEPVMAVGAADPRKEKLCWDFRDHGTCRKGKDCPFSHDKDLRKRELERKGGGKGNGQESYPAKGGGKKGGKSKASLKAGAKKDGKGQHQPRKSDRPCPYFLKKGACKKGDACDMSHSLVATPGAGPETVNRTNVAASSNQLPAGWGAPSGSGLANPFGAFMVVTCGPGQDAVGKPAVAAAVLASAARVEGSEKKKELFTNLDQLPKDWWHVVDNDKGGYQYKTVTKILDKHVETLLDGGAGSNHVTEELVVSILNRAATLGLKPDDPKFPIVRFA